MLLGHDDHTFLLYLLLMLDLLVIGEVKRPLEFAVELSNLLIDAKKNFLLAHDLDRLEAIRFVLT